MPTEQRRTAFGSSSRTATATPAPQLTWSAPPSGAASGNALHWNYVLALPVDGRSWNMDMDDWMFLIDDRTMLNRTTMRKFGFRVGEVTLSFRRQ